MTGSAVQNNIPTGLLAYIDDETYGIVFDPDKGNIPPPHDDESLENYLVTCMLFFLKGKDSGA